MVSIPKLTPEETDGRQAQVGWATAIGVETKSRTDSIEVTLGVLPLHHGKPGFLSGIEPELPIPLK
jgi:hypothetical protein